MKKLLRCLTPKKRKKFVISDDSSRIHNYSLRPEGTLIDTVVIHDTVSPSVESSINWLSKQESRASYHYIVERDGAVHRLVSTKFKAWHAGRSSLAGRKGVNNFSIGIALVNPGAVTMDGKTAWGETIERHRLKYVADKLHGMNHLWLPYTEEQIAMTRELIHRLATVYPIKHVVGHYEISPGRKVDPNPLFPLDNFKRMLDNLAEDDQ